MFSTYLIIIINTQVTYSKPNIVQYFCSMTKMPTPRLIHNRNHFFTRILNIKRCKSS